MSATGARPPARQYREFCRVEPNADRTAFLIVSHPHPLHHATVTRKGSARDGWYWVVRYPTFHLAPSKLHTTEQFALNDAASAIGRRTGREIMSFDGFQRYAMGQQQCPFRGKGNPRLCEQPPDPGTVWCPNHKGGRQQW